MAHVGVRRMILVSLVMLLCALCAEAMEVCNTDTHKLEPCMPAVTQPPSDPVPECCQVINDHDLITCLCKYAKENPYLLKLTGIDPDLAKSLPAKCNLGFNVDCS